MARGMANNEAIVSQANTKAYEEGYDRAGLAKPPAWHWRARRRIAGWWYSVRAWVAEKVLRVEVAGEEDW